MMKDLLKLSTPIHYYSLCITLLGAAGSIFLLHRKLFLLPLRPRKPIRGPESDPFHHLLLRLSVPGLRNIGNNCFLNAILQALASSDAVLSFLGAYEREKVVFSSPGMEESCPTLPLTEALTDLLGELSILNTAATVASPRHVMLALEQYAKQFNLSLQQDAAEALAHLTDALQKEQSLFCENVRSYKESLCSTSGLYMDESPLKRIVERGSKKEGIPSYSWKPQFRFPIKGMMGSMLTCQKCGFQFSVLFQSFHDVPLSPPQSPDGNIVDGCNLEACLERFTAPEYVTNVRCSQCSHALILSLLKQRLKPNKVLIQRIEECTFHDDCSCEDLAKKEGEIWRNVYVNAWKQLRFGQCPELLCCQVQRAVISRTGELIKSTHHVSFPLALDLSPYLIMSSYSEEKHCSSVDPPTMSREADILRKYFLQGRSVETFGRTDPSFYNMPPITDESNSDDTHLSISSGSEDLSSDALSESTNEQIGEVKCKESSDICFQPDGFSSLNNMYGDSRFCDLLLDDGLPHLKFQNPANSSISLDPNVMGIRTHNISHLGPHPARVLAFDGSGHRVVHKGSDKLMKDFKHSNGAKNWIYDLISVVVHSGSPKSGHYIVYRRAKFKRATYPWEDGCSDMSWTDMPKENHSKTCHLEMNTFATKFLGNDNGIGDSLRESVNQDELLLWFRVSDSRVDMVSEAEVLMAQASLLFYERRKCAID